MKRLILLCALLFAGCEVIGGIGGTDSANKSNTPEEPRIVFGESIDDVRIGDNSTEVVQKLGEFDQVQPADLAGEKYIYLNGEDSLEIAITISDDPAVGLGVCCV